MATPSTQNASTKKTTKPAPKAAKAAPAKDAIALLKADHREAEDVFAQFEKARSDAKKQALANKVCTALKVHMEIEEEIFYPAFLKATGDRDLNNEATVEHDSARKLIAEIEEMSPDEELYDAKVKVLSEMIEHHVEEEEKPKTGMFAEARAAKMDLEALGAQMQARKDELMEEMAS